MRDKQIRDVARLLRSGTTDAERHLWRYLRQRQVGGHRFRRQHPVGPCIADFACIEQQLIVEVDGGRHSGSASDVLCSRYLAVAGYVTLRFWNHDVLSNIEGVIPEISRALVKARPHPSLPPQAGEGT